MGILEGLGESISFEELARNQPLYQKLAVQQFLYTLNKHTQAQSQAAPQPDVTRWGWEIEGHMLTPDAANRLSLYKHYPLAEVFGKVGVEGMVEVASWMFELVPKKPYATKSDLAEVARDMLELYNSLNNCGQTYLTIPHIPLVGAQNGAKKSNKLTQSQYVPDEDITVNPRYVAMVTNMIERRNGLPHTYLPLYQDTNTHTAHQEEPKPNHIHTDSLMFGFSSACLQTTFETDSFRQARHVHDQLNIASPIFLAMTAGTPFIKGKIADTDARYDMISQSADDRTAEEKDPNHPSYFPTSRHGTCNFFIGSSPANLPEYSDFDTRIRKEAEECVRKELAERNIQLDEQMIKYLAIIVSRDHTYSFTNTPLDETSTEIYDLLLGTHWGSVKLKLPTETINWRVELRTMEVQLTPDENAAFSVLSYLLTCLLKKREDLNFYVPITCYRENMRRAHLRNAVVDQKFLWRTNIHSSGQAKIEELSCFEIFFGKDQYEGLFGLFETELAKDKDLEFSDSLEMIKTFLVNIFTGRRLTLAQWMRKFVERHPLYQHNSILPPAVMDDLFKTLDGIQRGTIQDPNFTPVFVGALCKRENTECSVETDSCGSSEEREVLEELPQLITA